MDSVKIKALLRAAELGSLTKAAEELGYTQAGLTHMMTRLEAEVGFELLLRNKNGVKLTPEGEKLLPYLKDFSISHEQLKRAVDETSRGLGEIVRIGTYTSILKLWLPTVINGFKKISPEIRIEIHDLGINAMYDRVSISEIDLAFGSFCPSDDCDFIPLKKDPFYAVLPKSGTEFDGLSSVPITALSGKSFIMPTYGYDPDILEALHKNSVTPILNTISVSDSAVAALVEIGLGMTILPELVLNSIDKSGVEIKRLLPDCSRELGIIIPKGKIKSPIVRSFVEYSENVIKENFGDD